MRKLALALLILPIVAQAMKPLPLSRIVDDADMIVVGRLSAITRESLSITVKIAGRTRTENFDRAEILEPKILKGRTSRRFLVFFPSQLNESIKEGDSGVWFLFKEEMLQDVPFMVRTGPHPPDTEMKVLKILVEERGK